MKFHVTQTTNKQNIFAADFKAENRRDCPCSRHDVSTISTRTAQEEALWRFVYKVAGDTCDYISFRRARIGSLSL